MNKNKPSSDIKFLYILFKYLILIEELKTNTDIYYTKFSQHEPPLDKRAISDVVLTKARIQLKVKKFTDELIKLLQL